MTDLIESKNLSRQESYHSQRKTLQQMRFAENPAEYICPSHPHRVRLKQYLFDYDNLGLNSVQRPQGTLQEEACSIIACGMNCLVSFRRQEKQNTSLDSLQKQLIADRVLNKLDFSTNHSTLLIRETVQPLLLR